MRKYEGVTHKWNETTDFGPPLALTFGGCWGWGGCHRGQKIVWAIGSIMECEDLTKDTGWVIGDVMGMWVVRLVNEMGGQSIE